MTSSRLRGFLHRLWWGKVSFLLGVWLVVAFGGQASAQAQTSLQERGRVGPGEVVVYELRPAAGSIARLSGHPMEGSWGLTEAAQEALALAPAWLRVSLEDKLGQLPEELQDEVAAVVEAAWAEDPRMVDEVAFAAAHLAVEDYLFEDEDTGVVFDPSILLENARWIYAMDGQLGYVELVEVGDPTIDDEFYTTARYRLGAPGEEADHELTREAYYWWVVHPKVSMEPVVHVDPPSDRTQAPADGGRFWREYLLAERGTPDDPTRPFVLRVPEDLSNESLNSWGPSASGYLTSESIDPLREVVRTSDGEAVLLRLTYHTSNTGGGYNGTVWATTMPVETAYRNGDSDLLVNLVSVGDGNVKMKTAGEVEPVLVLKDRDPFGHATVEEVLVDRGYEFDVMDSTGFSAIATAEDLEALGYQKIIVPSDQPRSFYEALSANREVINGWVGQSSTDDDNVFAFHGAVDAANLPVDDWSDLAMPGGVVGHDLGDTTEEVEPWGYPRVGDVMSGATSVWDGETQGALSGDRFLDPSMTALNRLGYLVSQNLDDNVAELPGDWAGPDGDCGMSPSFCVVRSVHAARVVYGHYENCGGIGILMTAMGRAALLPVMKVSGGPEDHEWNEFYLQGAQHPLQVDWSDGPTRIAVPGNGQDKDYGGGKDLSMVFAFRGDGLALNTMERYSETVVFSIDVTDASGHPVDGASVIVATETYYDEQSLMLATVEVTDANGHVEFPVGDLQNYYIQVESPAGAWPDADHVSWVACAHQDATNPGGQPCPAQAPWAPEDPMPKTDVPGETIQLSLVLDGPGVQVLEPTLTGDATAPAGGEGTSPLQVTVDVSHRVRYLPSLATASETEVEGSLGLYLVDTANMLRFFDGEEFQAWRGVDVVGAPDGEGATLDVELPDPDATWYLLLDNSRYVNTAQHYHVEMEMGAVGADAGVDATPSGGGGGGCGCRSADTHHGRSGPAGGAWLILLVVGLVWVGKRRKGDRRLYG